MYHVSLILAAVFLLLRLCGGSCLLSIFVFCFDLVGGWACVHRSASVALSPLAHAFFILFPVPFSRRLSWCHLSALLCNRCELEHSNGVSAFFAFFLYSACFCLRVVAQVALYIHFFVFVFW